METVEQLAASLNGREYSFELAVHTAPGTGAIAIVYPGYGGERNGFNEKYVRISEMLAEQGVAASLRLDNRPLDGFGYPELLCHRLDRVLEHARMEGQRLSGSATPRIYLMGISAGGSAAATVAYRHPDVASLLLMAPSGDAGLSSVAKALPQFTGDVFVMVGKQDQVVGPEVGPYFFELASAARRRELLMVDGCDHQFRGSVNGRLLSQAPFWAFAGAPLPSPELGVELY